MADNSVSARPASKAGFVVETRGNQVMLTVYPDASQHPVAAADVYAELVSQRLPKVDLGLLQKLAEDADGLPHVIIEDLSTAGKDAEFILTISADRMQAKALIRPAAWGLKLTHSALQQELQKAGVRFGVVPGILDEIVINQDQEREWLIAEGQPPVDGTDASIHYLFPLERAKLQPAFLPDGRVDFRELDNIINVDPGQVLAERKPPIPGKPGWTVFHEELPPKPGREVLMPAGKGVKVVGDLITAELSGQLLYRQNKITVSPVHRVDGDVDYASGNIRFVGNVQIAGSVKPGFVIEAEGDVQVAGWVDSANVFCQGSLVVGSGIQGQGRGQVKAGGDIITRFIENCDVSAGGSIRVGEDIMHSIVSAGRSIEVGGRRGLIAGGIIRAADSITCKVLGASLGTPTVVEVGTDPGTFEQYGRLQGEIARMESEMEKLILGIKRLLQVKELTGSLPAERLEMLQRLQTAYRQRQQEVVEKRGQLALHEAALTAIKEAHVRVTEIVHPGTRIVIGKASYFTQERMPAGFFRLVEGDVVYQHS